ncbi:phosphoglycerate mutase family protein [Tritrichomonas foetus]|uniref:phosphoglycerate mutase (2,3-diphosphoglycerate-dependent) n=1 Tax=Tritrichomonas foetus TaxID=1144522 RepID=A0A1J4JX89_9EUKA|nr:phosphoglycerate mutase family protein [Tritrichomonas foetus]|eukprot:OHT03767.1 phosphoglycerate mutase family protein [Tritrichomonas foetus]
MLSCENFSRLERQIKSYPHLPVDLIIVRNGASDGSVIINAGKKGIEKMKKYKPELRKVHNSKWRLTEFGIFQAKAAGRWIKENFSKPFDAYLTGEYIRSLETAARLDLKEAKWIPSLYLRPRDFGAFSELDRQFSKAEFNEHMREKSRDSFYWTPPNGESIAHLTLRTERVINWIRTHVPENGSAIIVTHKDVMDCLRIRIERISQMDYKKKVAEPPFNHILYYGSILQYTRRNPNTNEVVPHYRWMRVITPWLGKHFSPPEFEPIITKHYGNSELIGEVSNVPHLFKEIIE